MRKAFASLVVVCLVLVPTTTRAADRVFGVAHSGGQSSPSTLYEFDIISLAPTAVGPIGFNSVGGIDFDPMTGALYGVGRRPADDVFVLLFLNPGTGKGTEVAPLSIQPIRVFDLSFRDSDGALFMSGIHSGFPCVVLNRIDLETGVVSDIHDTTTCDPGNALGFDGADHLFLINHSGFHFELDAATGLPIAVTPLNYLGGGLPRVNAMDFIPFEPIAFASLNFGSEGSGPNALGGFVPGGSLVVPFVETVPGLDAIAFTADPLAVQLESFEAEVTSYGVRLTWSTSTEIDHAGFRILRATPGQAKSVEVVTPDVIPAAGSDLEGADYEYLDTKKHAGRVLAYYLEDIDLFGVTTLHGPIFVDTGYRASKPRRRSPQD